MNITKAKLILGKLYKEIDDSELEKIISSLSNIADVFIEQQKGLVNNEK